MKSSRCVLILIYLTNYIVFVNTTNKFKFLLRHVSASQGHHQAYKEVNLARVFHSTVNVMKVLYETVFHSILGGI